MDKQSAIRLLDETFNSDFDLNRFIWFVKELFNDFTVNQRDCTKYIAEILLPTGLGKLKRMLHWLLFTGMTRRTGVFPLSRWSTGLLKLSRGRLRLSGN